MDTSASPHRRARTPSTRQKVLPVLALLLALAELGLCVYFLVRASWTVESLEVSPHPVPEAPPGTDLFYDEFAYTRPVLVLVLILLVTIGTAVTAFMSHPWTERDPNHRISPWPSLAIASVGLVILPGLFSILYLTLVYLVIVFAARLVFGNWEKLSPWLKSRVG